MTLDIEGERLPSYISQWFQNRLIINLWQHWIEVAREFKTMGIIRGGGGEEGIPMSPELSPN